MKKLPIALKTPARVVIVVGLIVLLGELLIMLLIDGIHNTILKDEVLEKIVFEFIDPFLLVAIVSPAFYLLIFRPMRAQQVNIERQLDELHRFQKVAVGRELRMKELMGEIAALRNPLSTEPAGNIPVTSGSLEASHHAAEQPATTQPTEESQHSALLFMLEDLEVARKKIEQAHQEWIAALDVVNDPIFLHDRQFRILRCNKAYQQRAGMPFKQIIGQPYYEVFPKNHEPLLSCLRALEKTEEAEEEVAISDTSYRSRAFSIYDEQGAYLYSVHTLEDITERKQAEAAIQQTSLALENMAIKFRTVFESSFDAVMLLDEQGFSDCNLAAMRMFGSTTRDGLIGKYPADISPLTQPGGEDSKILIDQIAATAFKTGGSQFDWVLRRLDGSEFYAEVSLTAMELNGKPILQGTVRDITERKQAEADIEHANRALTTLSAVNRTLVHATDENELLQAICQAIVEQRGYLMAWVGYVQHDENKSIMIMAHAGQDEGYLDAMQLTWAETERGMGSSGRAIRSGATQLCQDIINDPHYQPWRDAALKRGYAANIALPLRGGDNMVFGILNVYAKEVNAFIPKEIDLLEEMAGDMAFGVRSLHTRHERDLALVKNQEQLVQLQGSLENTVQAMAAIVEMRDPYTAGHQVRVADLSAAIAKRMALPEEQIHAIHLAGVVHDLGKIKVPAEILSKPGKLTDLEFGLIKTHAQAGYDILKDINFPWPIAQMVLQHHERMDGSGYPQGLKGEAILLKARILAVADATEAICSHRPYRPGLGIEFALAEITKQRGIYYDPQVVDACLAVFREQGYQLPS